jgi:hypothetical protein
VPNTALSWVKKAMSEVIDRHESVEVEVFLSLYMDHACCNGKAGSSQSTSRHKCCCLVAVNLLYQHVKLNAMHLMLHIGREINAEHPRRKKFLVDLSHAMFVQHEGDHQHLMQRFCKSFSKTLPS